MTAVVDTPAAHSPGGEAPEPPKGVRRRGFLGFVAAIATSLAAGAVADRVISGSGETPAPTTTPEKTAETLGAAADTAKGYEDALNGAFFSGGSELSAGNRVDGVSFLWNGRVTKLPANTRAGARTVVTNPIVLDANNGVYGSVSYMSGDDGQDAQLPFAVISVFRGQPEGTPGRLVRGAMSFSDFNRVTASGDLGGGATTQMFPVGVTTMLHQ